MTYKRQAITALAAVLLAATSAYADAQGGFTRTLNVSGPVDLTVQTGSGRITIKSGAASTVRVNAVIRARDQWFGGSSMGAAEKVKALESNPPIQQTGNTIVIGKIEDSDLKRNVSISYDIEVPANTTLVSSTGSGDQVIDGLGGAVKASTGSGSVTITDVKGAVRAQTGSGNLDLNAIAGPRTYASTGSGSISARGVTGEFEGQTGSGNIRLDQTGPGDVRVSAGSGSIELANVKGALRAETGSGDIEITGEPTGAWRLDTGSGSVEISVPGKVAFDIDARTSSGSVTVDHEVTVQGTVTARQFRGKVRGGGALLAVHTGSGNIRIR